MRKSVPPEASARAVGAEGHAKDTPDGALEGEELAPVTASQTIRSPRSGRPRRLAYRRGLSATLVSLGPDGLLRTIDSWPVLVTSQTRTVLSRPAEARRAAVGAEGDAARPRRVAPEREELAIPAAASQTRTTSSRPPDARRQCRRG